MKQYSHCLIIGFGVSGKAMAQLLARKEIPFYVAEKDVTAISPADRAWLAEIKAGYGDESQASRMISSETFDCVIVSPGVPLSHQLIQQAQSQDIAVWGELEFAAQFLSGTLIGVTGSNGKTSTVHLLYEILKNGNRAVKMAGNMGVAVSSVACEPNESSIDIYVLELSSYQLDLSSRLMLDVGIITSISPDHCDRYDSYDHYVGSKLIIAKRLKKNGMFVCSSKDIPVYEKVAGKKFYAHARSIFIGDKTDRNSMFYPDRDTLWLRKNDQWVQILDDKSVRFSGNHMVQNAAMAAQVAYSLGVDDRTIVETIKQFSGLPHRLERVAEHTGIEFYDDSKATNPDAVIKALDTFSQPVVLILGGRDKGADLSELKEIIARKVKKIVLIGETTPYYERVFAGSAPMVKITDMNDAVNTAYNNAQKGDIVLLSPACASFDMYKNFEERGDAFKLAVHNLVNKRI